MRVCWISTLVLGLFHSALFPSSTGLEGGKKIGVDDVYKPRKWSQVRDGPYRMVVSSRDQNIDDSQLESRKSSRSRPPPEEYKREEKETVNEAVDKASDQTKDAADNLSEVADQEHQPLQETTTPKEPEADPTVAPKQRTDRRKIKTKFDHVVESSSVPFDNYDKSEKSTQRTITKIARKRERILSNEHFRKAHRVSATADGHFSTVLPSTISHKLYNHFRPIDRGIPRESIIPFFDFGKKLSTGKPPNAINSIEGSSTPGGGTVEITTRREDDDLFHENMDVSVVRLKPVEWNSPPRARPPPKNPELTSYFKPKREEKVIPTTPLPEDAKEDLIPTSDMVDRTSSLVDPSVTLATTTLPPEASNTDLQPNESKPTFNVSTTKQPSPADIAQKSLISQRMETINRNQSTQLPRPSPTAKILSTAVVTSVSVKEPIKSREKEDNPLAEEVENISPNITDVKFQQLKSSESVDLKDVKSETSQQDSHTNYTHRTDKSLSAIIVPSTHRPSFDRFLNNKTLAHLKNNATIHPTTIRPKFRSNIEYHTFATKVPTTTTTHKPVNRSLYSTFQREQQKNKLITFQHHRPDNRTLFPNQTFDNTTAKGEIKQPLVSNENKTKMYLTIRSRLPNQAATYRSTFRRNGTKPIPPVLRVIATPSSYIEVPRIISRLANGSTTTTPNPIGKVFPRHKIAEINPEDIESSTETVSDTTLKYVNSSSTLSKYEKPTKVDENLREVRMNNHRMPTQEITTDSAVELTTEVVIQSFDTTTPAVRVPSVTRPARLPNKDSVNIVTVGPRSSSKPGLSWVYLGQKNRTRLIDNPSVEAAYWSGFGIAAYVLAALGIVPLILGGFILLRQILIKSKKKMLDESEYSSEYNRTPLPTKLPRITSHIVNWEGEKATSNLSTGQATPAQGGVQHQSNQLSVPTQHQSTHSTLNQHQPTHTHTHTHLPSTQHLTQPGKWEFPRDKLRLQTLLGEGNFGQVWKAEADDISGHEGLTRLVAVKTVKEGSGGREREDLLRELDIMKELGSHPNVVTLLGCCTDREPFLLIMEYVMYGKMLTFLREHRTRAHYFNFSDLNSALVSRDLTVFAYCVARGMEFIVSKGIIHRDLAARNILVDHNKLCKIADFGMSRNVRDTGEIYEQRPNRGALPIRWMAPEALHCNVFTHKSDVWSFGILVWEIITLGCTPYQTMGAREVMRKVREGYRLERPIHCSQELYKVITRCWASDSSKRPSFTDIKHDLATLLSDPQTNGAYVDLDALTEEMSTHSC